MVGVTEFVGEKQVTAWASSFVKSSNSVRKNENKEVDVSFQIQSFTPGHQLSKFHTWALTFKVSHLGTNFHARENRAISF
jgi:hypothetical protein